MLKILFWSNEKWRDEANRLVRRREPAGGHFIPSQMAAHDANSGSGPICANTIEQSRFRTRALAPRWGSKDAPLQRLRRDRPKPPWPRPQGRSSSAARRDGLPSLVVATIESPREFAPVMTACLVNSVIGSTQLGRTGYLPPGPRTSPSRATTIDWKSAWIVGSVASRSRSPGDLRFTSPGRPTQEDRRHCRKTSRHELETPPTVISTVREPNTGKRNQKGHKKVSLAVASGQPI